MSTRLVDTIGALGERLVLPLVALAAVAVGTVAPQLLAAAAVLVALACWVWLVDRDYVLALSVFLALMPLWLFLKFVEWPSVVLGGGQIFLATLLKEAFMLIFFFHWLLAAVHSDRVIVRMPIALLGFFGLVAVALLQGGLLRYPMLLRPFVETFLLVAVPLLSIDLTKAEIDRLLIATVIGGGSLAAIALYHTVVDPQLLLSPELIREEIYKTRFGLSAFLGPRLQSLTGNPNNLGQLMLVTSVISFGLTFRGSLREKPVVRSVFFFIFSLSAVILMLSRSRDDILFLAMGIGLFVVIQRRIVPMVLGVLIFGIAALLNIDQLTMVFQRLLSQGNPRFDTWLSGIRFYGLELVTGVGDVDNRFTGMNNPYDNTYFRLLIQVGIVGLTLFLITSGRVLSGLIKGFAPKNGGTDIIVFVLIATLLASFLFRASLLIFPFSLYYWFAMALGVRMLHDVRIETERTT